MENIRDLVKKIQEFDFKSEYKQERDPKIKIKFLAFHHLQSGKILKDVADIILYDEKAIRRWIRAFIEFDYEGVN